MSAPPPPLPTRAGSGLPPTAAAAGDRQPHVPAGQVAPTPSAAGTHVDHDDPLAAEFFRHPDRSVIDIWEDPPVLHSLSRGSRRAMQASIGIFAVSLLAIGGYSAYHHFVMPAPVELGAGANLGELPALPTPPPSETTLAAARDPAARPGLRLRASLTDPSAPTPAPSEAAPQQQPSEPAAAVQPMAASVRAAEAGEQVAAAGAVQAPQAQPSSEAARAVAPSEPTRAANPADSVAAHGAASSPAPASQAPTGTTRPTHDELLAVGHKLSLQNRRTEAIEAFQRALIQLPESSSALSGLSYVYLNAEDNGRARDFAQRAVVADASNAEGWIVLGAARELLGDRDGALAAYRSCVAQGKGPYLSQCRQVAR